MLRWSEPSAPRSEQATWVRVPGQLSAGMGTGQQHTQGTAHLRGPWSHTPVIGPGQALDVGTRGVFPLGCERSEQWRETITASSPSTLRAGLNRRVWHWWKRSCTADAALCRPIARSHPPGCTETMAPPAFPSWAKPTSEVPGAPPFLSLFQHDSSLHVPPGDAGTVPPVQLWQSDSHSTAARAGGRA